MATGRIGVTPTLGVRWSKAPAGGTTSLSGLDDNSVSLVYSVGYEQVYRNGVLLSRTNDYTATNGTTITLIDATITGDIIEVFANELVPLTDAISKGQFNAKGALLSATAASTPGVLAVGANDTVLTADSSTSTGLKWAAPSSGGMTLISTTNASSSASIALTSIPGTYRSLRLVITDLEPATNNTDMRMRINNNSGASNYYNKETSDPGNTWNFNSSSILLTSAASNGASNTLTVIDIPDYANATTYKIVEANSVYIGFGVNGGNRMLSGYHNQLAAITELNFFMSSGNIASGKFELYGVK